MARRWRAVVGTIPPLPAAATLAGAESEPAAGDAATSPPAAAEFEARLRADGWRGFLFRHVTAAQMLHEVADTLYGVSEALAPASTATAAAGHHGLLTFDDVMEGVRRISLLMDPRRRGVAAHSVEQRAAVATNLLRDAGATHLLPGSDGTSVAGSCRDSSTTAATESGGRYIPLRFGRRPADLMRDMPRWFVAGGIVQAHAVRLLAGGMGVRSAGVSTNLGDWHTYVADGRCTTPDGKAGVDDNRPIVLLHGMFTTSVSVLPLGIVLAAATRRLVLIPGLLDFDFGFSRSRAEAWTRLRAQRAAAAAGMLSPPAGTAAAAAAVPADRDAWVHDDWAALEWVDAISPLSWSDHIPAVAEYLRDAVPRLAADAGCGSSPAAVPPPDVIGHSLGGWLAAKIAARHPATLRRVVLLAPGGLGRYRILSSAASLAGVRTSMALMRDKMSPPAARAAAVVFDTIARAPFTVHMLSSLDYRDYFEPGERVPSEALLVWGTADDLHRVWHAPPGAPSSHGGGSQADVDASLLADLPRGTGVWVEGAGHALVIDSIPALSRLLTPFLNGAAGPDATPCTPAVPRLHTAAAVIHRLAAAAGGDRATAPMAAPSSLAARL